MELVVWIQVDPALCVCLVLVDRGIDPAYSTPVVGFTIFFYDGSHLIEKNLSSNNYRRVRVVRTDPTVAEMSRFVETFRVCQRTWFVQQLSGGVQGQRTLLQKMFDVIVIPPVDIHLLRRR